MLTKSATPNASRRPAAERSEGAVPIRLADERREQVHARKEKSKVWRVRSNTQQVREIIFFTNKQRHDTLILCLLF